MGNQPGDSAAPSDIDGQPTTTKRHNPVRTGEIAEAAFLHKVINLGFGVAKPWGNSERYDFILDNGQRLWRVQLKCSEVLRPFGGYDIQPMYGVYGKSRRVYTADDIDVLIAYITPVDAWYVLPIELIYGRKSLRFYPTGGCKRPRFEHYREAWHLLRPEPEFMFDIQACADPLFSHICHSDPFVAAERGENEGGICFPQPLHNRHITL
jgi:hypothetical protein